MQNEGEQKEYKYKLQSTNYKMKSANFQCWSYQVRLIVARMGAHALFMCCILYAASDMPLAAKVLSADLQLFVDPSIAVGFPNQGPTGSNDVRRGAASTESTALSAVVRYCIHSTNTALRCAALRCVALR